MSNLSETERNVIIAIQDGLPLDKRPYRCIAEEVGITEDEAMEIVKTLQDRGVIKRLGVVPDHYALGYLYNGMTVWEIPEDEVEEIGLALAEEDYVTHSYQRPRYPPDWTYNLFAMVHGKDEEEVERRIEELQEKVGYECDVLYSTEKLKKTGIRLAK